MFSVRLTSAVIGAVLVTISSAVGFSQTVQPEDGYLSPTRYLSRYFGLALAFPTELNLVPAPVSQVQGSTRWLLGVQTTSGTPTNLVITATPSTKKDAVSALRSDFTELADKPKPVAIGGRTFWKAVSPRPAEPQQPQTVEYASIALGHLLKIRITTSAGPVPDALTAAIEGASWLAPDAVSGSRTADMIAYEGPALPPLDKPTEAISELQAGTSDGRRYRNDALGLEFIVPEGLTVRGDQRRSNETVSGSALSTFEQQVAHACTRSLLLADAGTRSQDGHVTPAVTIIAVDRLCLGGVRFPTALSDSGSINRVAQMLAERIHSGRAGSPMKGRVYSLEGHVMLNLAGVVYGTEPGTGLRVPNRIRIIATEVGDYWVIWTFLAPDASSLDRLSSSTVRFYPPRERKEPATGGGLQ